MKRIILMILIAFLFVCNGHAQIDDDKSNNDFNRWQVRLRGIVVTPDESANIQTIGGDVNISTTVVPELDFTYFFTENWAAELILATTNHDVEAVNTSAGNIDLGDVWLLPPTLTLQYHFAGNILKPYIGAGINYTIFYGVDEGPIVDDIDYDNTFGFALQAGLDIMINDKWFLNLDIKKIFLEIDSTIDATSALNANVFAKEVEINPLVIGFGFGLKF